MTTEPTLKFMPKPVVDYVYYPDGHPNAGDLRLTEGAWTLAAVIIIQVLVMAWVAASRRALARKIKPQ